MASEKTPFDVEAGRIYQPSYIPQWIMVGRAAKASQSARHQTQEYIDLTSKLEENTYLAQSPVNITAESYVRYIQSVFHEHRQCFDAMIPSEHQDNYPKWSLQITRQLYDFLITGQGRTISGAVSWLRNENLLEISMEDTHTSNRLAIELVFALIGILSMLYMPLPADFSQHHLSICPTSPADGYRFSSYALESIEIQEVDRPLAAMLLGFGELQSRALIEEDRSSPVLSTELSAIDLTTIGRIRIAWTDLLPAHLDFDSTNRTLYVFQRPTWCLLNIPSKSAEGDEAQHTLLEECLDFAGKSGAFPGINTEADYMKEVLLSIYLIFGQSPKSRKLFHKKKITAGRSKISPDPLLTLLCTQHWPFTDWSRRPKNEYILNEDFPVLGRKLQVLHDYLQVKQPSNIWSLWKDQRNTMQWWTFWAVLIIGGVGLIFAIVQTALSAAQVYYARLSLTHA